MSMMDYMHSFECPKDEPFAVSTLRAMMADVDKDHAEVTQEIIRTEAKLNDLKMRAERLEQMYANLSVAMTKLLPEG